MSDKANAILAAVGELHSRSLTRRIGSRRRNRSIDSSEDMPPFHIIADPSTGAVALSEQVGVDPVANELYLKYYAGKEVRIPPALTHGVREVFTEGTLLDRRTYERSEIYRNLLLPYDIPHIMAVWLQRSARACQAFIVEAGCRSQADLTKRVLVTVTAHHVAEQQFRRCRPSATGLPGSINP